MMTEKLEEILKSQNRALAPNKGAFRKPHPEIARVCGAIKSAQTFVLVMASAHGPTFPPLLSFNHPKFPLSHLNFIHQMNIPFLIHQMNIHQTNSPHLPSTPVFKINLIHKTFNCLIFINAQRLFPTACNKTFHTGKQSSHNV